MFDRLPNNSLLCLVMTLFGLSRKTQPSGSPFARSPCSLSDMVGLFLKFLLSLPVASIESITLDTFNRQVILNFNIPINLTSFSSNQHLILVSGSLFMALQPTSVSLSSSRDGIVLRYDSAFNTFVEQIFQSWSPIYASVPPDLFVLANPSAVTSGSFPVVLYCLLSSSCLSLTG